MRHIVMFSGGAGSWAAAKRVVMDQVNGAPDDCQHDCVISEEDDDLHSFSDSDLEDE